MLHVKAEQMKNKKNNFRILQFTCENFKRLKTVNLTPDPHSVIITGPNEQGKSSILDAVLSAVAGKDSLKDIPEPVRKGQDKAEIKIDIGEYNIIRTFTRKDSYLKVTNREGASYKNPQTILDGLFNKTTIDPSVFLSQDNEKQLNVLKSVVKTNIDIERLEERRRVKYDERTIENKEVQSLQVCLNALIPAENGRWGKEKHPFENISKLLDVNKASGINNKLRCNLHAVVKKFKTLKKIKLVTLNKIKKLTGELEEIETGLFNYQSCKKHLDELVSTLIDPDVSLLCNTLSAAGCKNNKVREAKAYQTIKDSLRSHRQKAEKLSQQINGLTKKILQALEIAEFPVKGLGFRGDDIIFKGIPFTQCSQEERIKVALAIAMAQKPKLKVILLKDGSFLDKNNLNLVRMIAAAKNYQVWIESVDDTCKNSIVIEDGAVKPGRKTNLKRNFTSARENR